MRLFILLFFSLSAKAYIPPAQTIFERTADNSGSGSYTVEQEVQIPTSQEPLVIKETWYVENPNTLKLVATGAGDLKDKIKLTFVYSGGQRTWIEGKSQKQAQISSDFFENVHYLRAADQLKNALSAFGIKNLDSPRLARVGGVVAYSFGEPASATTLTPGLWIEQDQFVIRKLRLRSGAEWTGDSFSSFARGLSYPMKSQISWSRQSVQVFVHSVSSRMVTSFTKLEPNMDLTAYPQAQDFYAQFR